MILFKIKIIKKKIISNKIKNKYFGNKNIYI